jgi:hypothetical protein
LKVIYPTKLSSIENICARVPSLSPTTMEKNDTPHYLNPYNKEELPFFEPLQQ